MLRSCIVILAALCLSPTSGAEEALPRPSRLEPNVAFWKRIYSEVDGRGGLLHDSEHLEVVYEELRFPEGLSSRAREKRVEKIKKRYRTVLHRLAAGKRSGLTDEEARVLARWPEGVSNTTLRRAASRVRFQLGQADKFAAGVARSGRWRDYIERVLADRGVPQQLVALPHVESSYNPRAYSRVGAAGIWQFTRSTGRRYMRVDHVVDERMDPFAATVGAARLLRDNYERLESWPLAITAYNHGASGMARAVRKLGTTDMGEISHRYKSRTFGFASRNFYAEFLAALEVSTDYERYFGPVQIEWPLAYTTVTTDAFYSASTLERTLGVEAEVLREHNLALRSSVWSGAKLVPRGYGLRVPQPLLSTPGDELLAAIPDSERLARQHRDRFHKVRRGETLSKIARRYETTQSELVALNNLRSRHRIRAGQVLRLPDDGSGGPRIVARRKAPEDGQYRVERGDSLWVISQRFGASEQDLVRWNSLRNKHRLAVGQVLQVSPPPPPPTTVVVASASSAATDAKLETRPVLGSVVALEPEPAAAEEPAGGEAPREDSPAAPGGIAAAMGELAALITGSGSEGEAQPPGEDVAPASEAGEGAVAEAPAPDTFAVAEAPDAADESAVAEAPDESAVGEAAPPAVAVIAAVHGDAGDTALPDPRAEIVPPPDPSNYAVTPGNRITVQAEETLGHYAEWLEVPTSRLRRINGMTYQTPLVIGRTKKLDFGRVSPEVFEQRRLAYHRDLQEEFFEAFVVTGTTVHTLRRGESLWYVANERYQVPLWLLRQYNPDLDFGDLHAGAPMVIPTLEPRT